MFFFKFLRINIRHSSVNNKYNGITHRDIDRQEFHEAQTNILRKGHEGEEERKHLHRLTEVP